MGRGKIKVLVTGGAGFIGSHIVDLLDEQGYKVIVVDNLSTGTSSYLPSNIKLYELDLRSETLESVFQQERPEFVIHQAAQVDVHQSVIDPVKDAENNILSTIRLLTYCHKYGVKKIIYASSCAIYGETADISILESFVIQPISFYGISKFTPEMYIRCFYDLFGLSYTILRYSNVYGPRQIPKGEGGVVSIFFRKLLSGESPYIFGDGNQTRDFVYVRDVAMANVLALYKGTNEILNISSNEKVSINQLYHLITSIMSINISPSYGPARQGDIQYSQLDNIKAKQVLGWEPTYNLISGLQECFQYYVKKN